MKWFDKAKGFGFANVFGRPDDVFIHIEVLRRSGFADLQPGEAVCLRVVEGKRGRMAVTVISWEAALREKAEADHRRLLVLVASRAAEADVPTRDAGAALTGGRPRFRVEIADDAEADGRAA